MFQILISGETQAELLHCKGQQGEGVGGLHWMVGQGGRLLEMLSMALAITGQHSETDRAFTLKPYWHKEGSAHSFSQRVAVEKPAESAALSCPCLYLFIIL